MKGKTAQIVGAWLRKGLSTPHHRMVTLGLLMVVCYLPLWLTKLIDGILHGSGAIFMAAALGLGLYRLWQQRKELARLEASEGDRWLGYFLIGISVLLFPLGFTSLWMQRAIWILIFSGIALSSWGASFFARYSVSVFLIAGGLFPSPANVAVTLWQTFTPPEFLERFMAWSGTMGLKAIGQPATQPDALSITLPGGAVKVYWACSGFDMAIVMASASLVVGLALQEPLTKVVLMIGIGVVLALLANIPRIMLMALAEAYWGKAAFEFWHGPWGGQIFSGILFTLYYYIVMGLRKWRMNQTRASSDPL